MAKSKNILNRDLIFQTDDRRIEELFVPEWKGVIFVRSLSGAERDEFEQAMVDLRAQNGDTMVVRTMRARMAVLAACDENGQPIFELTDVEALSQKSGAALDRIFAKAQELAAMSDEDVAALEGN